MWKFRICKPLLNFTTEKSILLSMKKVYTNYYWCNFYFNNIANITDSIINLLTLKKLQKLKLLLSKFRPIFYFSDTAYCFNIPLPPANSFQYFFTEIFVRWRYSYRPVLENGLRSDQVLVSVETRPNVKWKPYKCSIKVLYSLKYVYWQEEGSKWHFQISIKNCFLTVTNRNWFCS